MNASTRSLLFALASLSGCLWFLACTPFDWSSFAWVAAVPMLFAIDKAPSYKTSLLLGWWAGVVETAGGFYWLIDTAERFAGFPWLGGVLVLLLFCAARALIFLLFTAIVRFIRQRRRVPMALLAPLVMAPCEFLVPQLFPCGQWITQAWHPLVIQIAELTGPWGVTALLMAVNGALYDVLTRGREATRTLLAAAAVVAAALLFGTIRMRQIDTVIAQASRLRIGLVQPNFAYSNDVDLSRDEALRQLAALQAQSRRLQQAGAQLVVWSEGSYPAPLPRDFSADLPPESVGMIRRGFTTPVVIGADTVDANQDAVFNSALLLDGDGRALGRYDKVRLLAFGETIPGLSVFPWLENLLPAGSGKFSAGAGPEILPLPGPHGAIWRLGPLICYEDLVPQFIHDVGALHPDILVNLTVDSWYGAHSEPWEHLALAVFGSVELRLAMVRAVNSGVSALIDPNGRLLAQTYADDPYRDPKPADGIVVSAPKMPGGHTLFVAWGNWFPYTCLLATLVIGGLALRSAPAARLAKSA